MKTIYAYVLATIVHAYGIIMASSPLQFFSTFDVPSNREERESNFRHIGDLCNCFPLQLAVNCETPSMESICLGK
jgi:hypothetical protein